MRKYLIAAVAAIVSALALTQRRPGRRHPVDHREADARRSSRRRSYKPAQIYVEILTGPNSTDPTNPEQPPSAFNTKVNFPTNMKFDTKQGAEVQGHRGAAAEHDDRPGQAASAATSRSSARARRRRPAPSPTTGTSAWVTVDLPGTGTTLGVPVVVTAFNGEKKNQIFLHSRADSVNNTSVLVGKIKNGPKGYGKQLDVHDPAAPRRRDQPLHGDRQERQVRPGPVQDQEHEVPGDHRRSRTIRRSRTTTRRSASRRRADSLQLLSDPNGRPQGRPFCVPGAVRSAASPSGQPAHRSVACR